MKRLLLLSLFGFSFIACSAPAPTADSAETSALHTEAVKDLKEAPDFDLVSFDGGTINSQDLKGKIIVVDFWATWCKPCIDEIPNYNSLAEEQDSETVAMLGITLESGSYEDVEPYITKFGINYPVVMGNEEVVSGFGGLIGFPTTFVISPDWKIYKRYLGMRPTKKELIERDIIDLVSGTERK